MYSDSLNTREEEQNYNFHHRTWKSKVKEALKRMDNGKADWIIYLLRYGRAKEKKKHMMIDKVVKYNYDL